MLRFQKETPGGLCPR